MKKYLCVGQTENYGGLHGIIESRVIECETVDEAEEDALAMAYCVMERYGMITPDEYEELDEEEKEEYDEYEDVTDPESYIAEIREDVTESLDELNSELDSLSCDEFMAEYC